MQSEPLFSPDMMIWRVDREMALLLGGGRALLMQLAHPKIAAGVAQASRFQEDPLGRLARTMTTMWSIVFDDAAGSDAALRRVRGLHRRVRGFIGEGEPLPDRTGFAALDPELLFWVHATLVDSALVTYDRFVKPLSPSERAQYYVETRTLAAAFGLAESDIPASLQGFNAYLARMLSDGTIAVGPRATALARDILHPRVPVLRPAGPLFRFLTAGMLSADLRTAYGFSWSPAKEAALKLAGRVAQVVIPAIPGPLRVAPNARASEGRWATRLKNA